MFAKEQRYIERFSTLAAKAAQVQSRVKKLEKIEQLEMPRRRKVVRFDFRPPPRSGDDVVALTGFGKRYGSRFVYGGFDFLVRRGERWFVMGRNGAGKSTLLKSLASGPDVHPPPPPAPASPSLAALRRGWAQLIRRAYEVDALVCPRCRGVMRIVAFITEGRVIRRILDHPGASARRTIQDRAPPLAAAPVRDSR